MKFKRLFEAEVKEWPKAKEVEDLTHEVITNHGLTMRDGHEHAYDSESDFDGHQGLHDDLVSIGWKPLKQNQFDEKWDKGYTHPDHPRGLEMIHLGNTSIGLVSGARVSMWANKRAW